ncbi:hypothetical protein C9374_005115 [Naegleria lovaniensis]|uniref:Uncharacterized protein n=1 Tax=Naegleria lovaniensis TaxID=51637 RepID=A0AA88KKC6_NAELO|nr:uncharacterized protein C9374_005115 [Naegleria lovaniensis]KAG2382535.1 hypothetical protein C9374_005115 [Naegleria lovaniensis]
MKQKPTSPAQNVMEDVEKALDALEECNPMLNDPLAEEKICMENVCQCLNDCYLLIKQFTDGEEEFNVVLIDQSLECFQLADLSNIESAPLSTFSINEIVKIFINLKIYALKCLAKLISVCSLEPVKDESRETEFKELSRLCAESLIQQEGLTVLFECLVIPTGNVPNEPAMLSDDRIRLLVVECLFVLVCRNEIARLAVVFQQGLLLIMELMTLETVPLVRSYYSAILREFSVSFAEDLIKENCIDHCLLMMSRDTNDDVRALSLETLETLFKSDVSKFKEVSVADLSKLLHAKLNYESPQVIESCCKLCETLFRIDHEASIHDEFIRNKYWIAFVNVVKLGEVRTASIAIKALRCLLQSAPSGEGVTQALIENYDAISFLISLLLDNTFEKMVTVQKDEKSKYNKKRLNKKISQRKLTHTHPTEHEFDSLSAKLANLESTLLLGVIMAKSTKLRLKIKDALKPGSALLLKKRMFLSLDLAEEEYYSDLILKDDRGDDLAKKLVLKEVKEGENVCAEYVITDKPSDHMSSIVTNDEDGSLKLIIVRQIISKTLSRPKISKAIANESVNTTVSNISQVSSESDGSPRPKRRAFSKKASEQKSASYPSPPKSKTPKTPTSPLNSFQSSKTSPLLLLETEVDLPPIIPVSILSPQDGEEFMPGFYEQPMNKVPKGDKPDLMFGAEQHRPTVCENSEFQRLINLYIAFSLWYESTEMRYQREEEQERFITAFQLSKLGKLSPMYSPVNSPKDPRAIKGTHLYYQKVPYHFKHSPQKLTKVWNIEDVKLSDIFQFEMPVDNLDRKHIVLTLDRLKKHVKTIAKEFIIAPKGHNARGRKILLLDLKQNVLPKLEQTINDLLNMGQQHTFKCLTDLIAKWKEAKMRSDSFINNENLLEIMEFLKLELKAQVAESTNRDDALNEKSESVDSDIQK